MKKRILLPMLVASAITGVSALAGAQASEATAMLTSPDGADVGAVRLIGSPNGVQIIADLQGLPAGPHGFHIHTTGSCAPDFTAAGGHFNPSGSEHGFNNENGYHAGDMPNVTVGADGSAHVEVFNTRVTLDGDNALFDDDGSAIIIHANADSHLADPMAGGRIACGVIER
jgi:Cu-Zn family superoxide dismutase